MQTLIIDATTALLRALRHAFPSFTGRFVLEEVRSRGWASITFTGARHDLAFRLEGEGAESAASAFLSSLRIAEFTLKDHILADVALVSEERRPGQVRIALEALTVEDA